MAKILTKNSVTAGSTPSGLSFGELAVNITDKKIFIGNAVQGVVTLHDQQNVVTSINGSTGAVTNVARINEGNTFSVLQVMNAGITTANLYVSGGATFSTVAATSTTNTIDAIASTDGIGLRVARAIGGGPSSVGGILLGRSSITEYNYLLYTANGTFYVINGTGAAAPQLMTLNSVDANFNVPIRGATFSSTAGRITVQKSGAGVGGESAVVRIVGVDALVNPYNSDIRANADATADTTHTLPSISGTLLNTSSTINATTSTITTSNVNATRYLAFVGGTGNTGIFIDDVTTPLTYTPSAGAIGAKKLTLTTSAQVITVDSGLNTVTFTDGADIATFGLNSIAANNGTPFEISNTNGLTFSSDAISFAGTAYGYLFPAANGTNGQALTTNGAGTLSWSTITGGLSWSAVTADRSLVAEEGVLANKSSGTLTLTLPTTAALGKVIRVSGMQNTWRIAQNASQKINFGNRSTTTGTGGYLENSNARDAVELVCCVANLEWNVISSIGNITIV